MCEDAEQKRQMLESVEMHRQLDKSSLGSLLSTFMAQAAVYRAMSGGPTALSLVMSMSRALVAVLADKNARRKTGLETSNGSMPKFIFIADIQGRRFAFHSQNAVLIREVCACFYGHASLLYGHASYLRRSIEAKTAEIVSTGASCLLVLAVPWGKALEDRAWRMFSASTKIDPATNSLVICDSEHVLTNAQTPPCPPGSSVNGRAGDPERSFASPELVQAFCNTYSAINLDETYDCKTTEPEPSQSPSSTDEVRVLRQLLEKLRADNVRLDEKAKNAEASKMHLDCESKRFHNEKAMLYGEIESLHETIDSQCAEVSRQRVCMDSLLVEIALLEKNAHALLEIVQRQRGDLLVAEESKNKNVNREKSLQSALASVKDLKKRESELAAQLREATEKGTLEKTRYEVEISELKDKLKSATESSVKKDAAVEALESERNELSMTIGNLKSTSTQSKQSSSETISRLVDTTHKLALEKDVLQKTVKKARTALLVLGAHKLRNELRHARLRASLSKKWVHCRLALTACKLRMSQAPPPCVDEQTASTASPISVQVEPEFEYKQAGHANFTYSYPADEIAATKRCISVLQNWVECFSNGNWSPQPHHHQGHHQQQQQQHQQHQPHVYQNSVFYSREQCYMNHPQSQQYCEYAPPFFHPQHVEMHPNCGYQQYDSISPPPSSPPPPHPSGQTLMAVRRMKRK
jgi:hypothetical protein